MRSRNLIRRTAAVGLSLAVLASLVFTTSEAEAQRYRYEEWQYNTKKPERGYEGFPAPGVYCSYRREPNRVCTTDKRGRETCKVKSWRLVQWCS
ncbi:hypothetical protein [Hyphomicrobium sp. CS1BSMeth3]|uniref:hypothetical protein n=1 Tax=Hyphomicrobium sp. CS1BSMeth3 TaxID=1892844 RepID=UPI00093174D2|nr:hypothetical protein [Hyphomicrobium sp. CS1BSMeth3]